MAGDFKHIWDLQTLDKQIIIWVLPLDSMSSCLQGPTRLQGLAILHTISFLSLHPQICHPVARERGFTLPLWQHWVNVYTISWCSTKQMYFLPREFYNSVQAQENTEFCILYHFSTQPFVCSTPRSSISGLLKQSCCKTKYCIVKPIHT